ncbi:MAG: hypothetical protein GXY27_02890 [Erysipelotrichaceae bacterium]|jgi:hypothetical protein|nr:hypothetical protein [Fibrobacter sp.]NLZ15609.1 hypothetical protein [Erysipelotrichaceae bacterium]
MFLNFLQTDEEKVAFIKMAIIVAIANVEDDNEEKNEKKSESFSRNKDWKMSSFEKAIINGFMKELELSSYEISTDEFNKIIDELSPVLSKLTRLSEEERRLEIIEKLIEDGISWDEIGDITPKSSRSMMIELISVALVDNDYAPFEKVVIKSIANKLKIDSDELEEMENFVRSMKEIYKTGLEIVNN